MALMRHPALGQVKQCIAKEIESGVKWVEGQLADDEGVVERRIKIEQLLAQQLCKLNLVEMAQDDAEACYLRQQMGDDLAALGTRLNVIAGRDPDHQIVDA